MRAGPNLGIESEAELMTKKAIIRRIWRAGVVILIVACVVAAAACDTSSQGAKKGTTPSSQSTGGGSSQNTIYAYISDLRNTRYCEFYLISKTDSGQTLQIYNTTGVDTCPLDKLDAMNADQIAKEYGADTLYKNAPRWWVLDKAVIRLEPKVYSFAGVKVRRSGEAKQSGNGGGPTKPYTEFMVARNTQWWYQAGKPVYMLIDHNSDKYYVMQSYCTIVDKNLTASGLLGLGNKLQGLPEGWEYKISILPENLSLPAVDGNVHVTQDELQNTYQLLTDANGKPLPVPSI